MRTKFLFIIGLLLSLFLTACGSDSTMPTLRPTLNTGDAEPTVDLGSGFDPELGNDDITQEILPTPTRESNTDLNNDNESGARGTGFTAQITGGSIDNINDGGSYGCNLTGHRIMSGDAAAPNITFTIPTDGAIATHTLDEDSSISIQIALSSVSDSYSNITGGFLTIDRVPAVAGDFVSGSYDFTIRNTTGEEIGVRGSFDFETNNTSYC